MPTALKMKTIMKLLNSIQFYCPSEYSAISDQGTFYGSKQRLVVEFLSQNGFSDAAVNFVLKMEDPHFRICALASPFLKSEELDVVIGAIPSLMFVDAEELKNKIEAHRILEIDDLQVQLRTLSKAIRFDLLSPDRSSVSDVESMMTAYIIGIPSVDAVQSDDLRRLKLFVDQKGGRRRAA